MTKLKFGTQSRNMSAAEQKVSSGRQISYISRSSNQCGSLDAGAEQDVANGMLKRVLARESPKADIVDKLQ